MSDIREEATINGVIDVRAALSGAIGVDENVNGGIGLPKILPGSTDYERLNNKPQINGVSLVGNKTGSDLGLDIVHIDTTANWNAQRELVSQMGHVYVYTDYMVVNGSFVSGIKIGDGNAFLIDIPFIGGNTTELYNHENNTSIHVTDEERIVWNNKVTCFLSSGTEETVVFTKENLNG